MRSHETLAVACSLTLALLLMSLLAAASFAQDEFDSAGEQQLAELINQERSREGLQPLAVDERLTQAARKHTEQMVKHKALSHQFDEEPSVQVRSADEDLRSDRQAENVALEMDVAGAHAILMNSPPHRANILSSKYNAVGIAVMRSGDRVYVTEDFAHRLPDYSELAVVYCELDRQESNWVISEGVTGVGLSYPRGVLRCHRSSPRVLTKACWGRVCCEST